MINTEAEQQQQLRQVAKKIVLIGLVSRLSSAIKSHTQHKPNYNKKK
jgi:hypothetical protein